MVLRGCEKTHQMAEPMLRYSMRPSRNKRYGILTNYNQYNAKCSAVSKVLAACLDVFLSCHHKNGFVDEADDSWKYLTFSGFKLS
eukprot:4225127-Amphidinium_carterae.1